MEIAGGYGLEWTVECKVIEVSCDWLDLELDKCMYIDRSIGLCIQHPSLHK